MPAHLVQNAARSWASVDLVPDVVLAPKTIVETVDAIEDSKVVVPRGVNEGCYAASSASTLFDHQPTGAAAAAATAAVKVAEGSTPSVSLQMLPFVGQLDTPGSESDLEHSYRRAEPPQFGSAMPPHGVASAGADDHHALHAEGSPQQVHHQRSPQTVARHLPQALEVSSGYRAPALWDEAGPKGSPGFTSEHSETTADVTSTSTSSAAAASGSAMARPSLCVCKKLAVGTMLIADSTALSCAADATAAGAGGAGANAAGGAAERPGRVCASRGKEVRLNVKTDRHQVCKPDF